MKSILLFAFVVVLVCVLSCEARAADSHLVKRDATKEEWEAYKIKFEKSYPDPAEDQRRFELYKAKVIEVNEHNVLYDKGEVSWSKGINQFADWTPEEHKRTHGLRLPPTSD